MKENYARYDLYRLWLCDAKGWKQPIRNAEYGGHGVVTMTYVLQESLNTGAIFAMQQIGAPTFAKYVHRSVLASVPALNLNRKVPAILIIFW